MGTGKEKAVVLISESVPHAVRFTGAWQMPGRLIIALLLASAPLPGIAGDRTLTLATWNIEHLSAADGEGCRPRDFARYDAIRKYLQRTRTDVVAFQEVEDLRAARRVFLASDYDIHISERPSRQFPECRNLSNNRLMQRTGFAVRKDITARLGMKALRQPDVRGLNGGYASGRRGVYLILQQVDAESTDVMPALPSLHLLSIHLKSRCTYQALTGKKNRPDCLILQRQIEALSDWINTRNRLHQDFIIAGDFNRQLDQLSDEVWVRMESGGKTGGYVDLEKVLHGIEHPQPYNPKYPYAIDHIIYNQALDSLVVEAETFFDTRADKYSDHLPLFAVFELARYGRRAH